MSFIVISIIPLHSLTLCILPISLFFFLSLSFSLFWILSTYIFLQQLSGIAIATDKRASHCGGLKIIYLDLQLVNIIEIVENNFSTTEWNIIYLKIYIYIHCIHSIWPEMLFRHAMCSKIHHKILMEMP